MDVIKMFQKEYGCDQNLSEYGCDQNVSERVWM